MITLIIVTKMMSWNDLALANYAVGCIDEFLLRKKFLSQPSLSTVGTLILLSTNGAIFAGGGISIYSSRTSVS
jgi:hypothetical protein